MEHSLFEKPSSLNSLPASSCNPSAVSFWIIMSSRRGQWKSPAVHFTLYSPKEIWTGEALNEGNCLNENWAIDGFLLHSSYLLASRYAFQVLNELF